MGKNKNPRGKPRGIFPVIISPARETLADGDQRGANARSPLETPREKSRGKPRGIKLKQWGIIQGELCALPLNRENAGPLQPASIKGKEFPIGRWGIPGSGGFLFTEKLFNSMMCWVLSNMSGFVLQFRSSAFNISFIIF